MASKETVRRELKEVIVAGAVTTTYTGVCYSDLALTSTVADAIWAITKTVATVVSTTTTTLEYYPVASDGKPGSDYSYIWDNRTSLTYC